MLRMGVDGEEGQQRGQGRRDEDSIGGRGQSVEEETEEHHQAGVEEEGGKAHVRVKRETASGREGEGAGKQHDGDGDGDDDDGGGGGGGDQPNKQRQAQGERGFCVGGGARTKLPAARLLAEETSGTETPPLPQMRDGDQESPLVRPLAPTLVPRHETFRVLVILLDNVLILPGQSMPQTAPQDRLLSIAGHMNVDTSHLFIGTAYDPTLSGQFRFGTVLEMRGTSPLDPSLAISVGIERFEKVRELELFESFCWMLLVEARVPRRSVVRVDALMHKHKVRPSSVAIRGMPYPPWLSRLAHTSYLRKRAYDLLLENLSWGGQAQPLPNLQRLSLDQFTYRLMLYLPLSLEQQARLFEDCNINTRLVHLINALALQLRESRLHCTNCRQLIAHKRDLISIMDDGNLGTFMNAHGFIHQIITLSTVTNCAIVTRPTLEDTWFKDYAWSILTCAMCGDHMGWRYDYRGVDDRPHRSFVGLRRSALNFGDLPLDFDPQQHDDVGLGHVAGFVHSRNMAFMADDSDEDDAVTLDSEHESWDSTSGDEEVEAWSLDSASSSSSSSSS